MNFQMEYDNVEAGSWSSLVIIVTRLQPGQPRFSSQQGQGIFLFITISRLALGSTQLLTQWVLGALSPGIKQLGHEEAPHICLVLRLRMCGTVSPFPQYVFMA
jgi:hypothetical protein